MYVMGSTLNNLSWEWGEHGESKNGLFNLTKIRYLNILYDELIVDFIVLGG